MKIWSRKITATQQPIVFSQWTRKSYAIFRSLGKVIKIGNLKVDVSEGFIKSLTPSKKANFFKFLGASDGNDEEIWDYGQLCNNPLYIIQLTIPLFQTPIASASCKVPIIHSHIYFANIKTLLSSFISSFLFFISYLFITSTYSPLNRKCRLPYLCFTRKQLYSRGLESANIYFNHYTPSVISGFQPLTAYCNPF